MNPVVVHAHCPLAATGCVGVVLLVYVANAFAWFLDLLHNDEIVLRGAASGFVDLGVGAGTMKIDARSGRKIRVNRLGA